MTTPESLNGPGNKEVSELTLFADASQRGIDAARARGQELGIQMTRVDVGRAIEISAESRHILIDEGMRATDRARTAMLAGPSDRETTAPELAGVIEDLSANPWHTGPLRDEVNRWVDFQLDETHQIVGRSNAIAEQVDSFESRGVARVVGQLAHDADHAHVAAAIARRSTQHGETTIPVSTRLEARTEAAVQAASPRAEAPSMRGSERYLGSRPVTAQASATRGIER